MPSPDIPAPVAIERDLQIILDACVDVAAALRTEDEIAERLRLGFRLGDRTELLLAAIRGYVLLGEPSKARSLIADVDLQDRCLAVRAFASTVAQQSQEHARSVAEELPEDDRADVFHGIGGVTIGRLRPRSMHDAFDGAMSLTDRELRDGALLAILGRAMARGPPRPYLERIAVSISDTVLRVGAIHAVVMRYIRCDEHGRGIELTLKLPSGPQRDQLLAWIIEARVEDIVHLDRWTRLRAPGHRFSNHRAALGIENEAERGRLLALIGRGSSSTMDDQLTQDAPGNPNAFDTEPFFEPERATIPPRAEPPRPFAFLTPFSIRQVQLPAPDRGDPGASVRAVELVREAGPLMDSAGVDAAIGIAKAFERSDPLFRDHYLFILGTRLARMRREQDTRAVVAAISSASPSLRARVMLTLVSEFALSSDHDSAQRVAQEVNHAWPAFGARAFACVLVHRLEENPELPANELHPALRGVGAAVRSAPYFGSNEDEGRMRPDVANLVWRLRERGDTLGLRELARGAGQWKYVEMLAQEIELATVHHAVRTDLERGDGGAAFARLRALTNSEVRDTLLGEIGRWCVERDDRTTALAAANALTPAIRDRALYELAMAWLSLATANDGFMTMAVMATDGITVGQWRLEPLLELAVLSLESADHAAAAERTDEMLRVLEAVAPQRTEDTIHDARIHKIFGLLVTRCGRIAKAVAVLQMLRPEKASPLLLALVDIVATQSQRDF